MAGHSPRVRLLIGLILAAPLLSGCTPEDRAFLKELATGWATERGLLDDRGNPNLLTIAWVLANPSSDPQAAAALQAGQVVKGLEGADRLAGEGARQGDLSKIEAAIRARPSDWSYHEQKAALLMAGGDLEGAAAATDRSEALVLERVRQGGDCRLLARNLLNHRLNALQTQLQRSPASELSTRLAETQTELDRLAAGQPVDLCP